MIRTSLSIHEGTRHMELFDRSQPATILFDLDGTLVDPFLGIKHCLQKISKSYNFPMPEDQQIKDSIGLGMKETLRRLGLFPNIKDLDNALLSFWDAYREEGLFEHELYPGIYSLLHRLKRQGHHIYIVSSKPGIFARRIAYQFDLNLIFDAILGSSLSEEWQSKREVVDTLMASGAIKGRGIMVGDRADDIVAGKIHGLFTIAVAYGYGSPSEIIESQPNLIVQSVAELEQWFQSAFPSDELFDPFNRSE
ncbi:MAG TPA: hypothetical protein DER35_00975 [Acidobacteria bacterium]|nr:hypothetical protein [Acidobacteriota bacterium]